MAKHGFTWLGICEPTNKDITKIRRLMSAAVPNGMRFEFIVPPVGYSVESVYKKLFQLMKPNCILLNDDLALFESFERYNVFLQCCSYEAKLDLESQLYVLNPHFEKKIYRDSDFEWYSKPRVWSEDQNERLLKEGREFERKKALKEYGKSAVKDLAEAIKGYEPEPEDGDEF